MASWPLAPSSSSIASSVPGRVGGRRADGGESEGRYWIVVVSPTQMVSLQSLVTGFPSVLERAVEDWAKFKVGVQSDLLSFNDKMEIVSWFSHFPEHWQMIRPNFTGKAMGTIAAHTPNIVAAGDRFVGKLSGNEWTYVSGLSGLGVLPLLPIAIVGGILIAGAYTISRILSEVGYIREQGNISRKLDLVETHEASADILTETIKTEKASVFGEVSDLFKYALVGAGLYLIWPLLARVVKAGSSR